MFKPILTGITTSAAKLFSAWTVDIPHSNILPKKIKLKEGDKSQPASMDSTAIESLQLMNTERQHLSWCFPGQLPGSCFCILTIAIRMTLQEKPRQKSHHCQWKQFQVNSNLDERGICSAFKKKLHSALLDFCFVQHCYLSGRYSASWFLCPPTIECGTNCDKLPDQLANIFKGVLTNLLSLEFWRNLLTPITSSLLFMLWGIKKSINILLCSSSICLASALPLAWTIIRDWVLFGFQVCFALGAY